jgi:DNA processing protein
LRHFGSWQEAWNSLKDPQSLGVPKKISDKFILERKKTDPFQIAEELEKKGINLITREDPSFSKLLLQISSIPCILYYCGNISILNSLSIAVIGSRKATQYGLRQAKEMAFQLAGYGLAIISGMARGIDAAAHEGALENEGNTIAVIGSALDMPYPRENLALFQRIKTEGLVISEYPLGTGPFKQNFPVRNRIISGISQGVFIIEAQAKSGTLITCDYALEQGKDVFALPGPVTSPNSIGTLRLIQNGAKLVIYPEDVLDELGYEYEQERISERKKNVSRLNQAEKDVLGCFFWEPVHIDKLLVNNDRQQVLYEILIKLEIKGLIKQLPGKYYVRV